MPVHKKKRWCVWSIQEGAAATTDARDEVVCNSLHQPHIKMHFVEYTSLNLFLSLLSTPSFFVMALFNALAAAAVVACVHQRKLLMQSPSLARRNVSWKKCMGIGWCKSQFWPWRFDYSDFFRRSIGQVRFFSWERIYKVRGINPSIKLYKAFWLEQPHLGLEIIWCTTSSFASPFLNSAVFSPFTIYFEANYKT